MIAGLTVDSSQVPDDPVQDLSPPHPGNDGVPPLEDGGAGNVGAVILQEGHQYQACTSNRSSETNLRSSFGSTHYIVIINKTDLYYSVNHLIIVHFLSIALSVIYLENLLIVFI